MTIAQSKKQILLSLGEVQQEVARQFEALPLEQAFRSAEGRWSPAGHLRHLCLSVEPLARALQMPKMTLRVMFGRSPLPGRSFEEMRAAYTAVLGQGGRAAGRYVPDGSDESPTAKTALLEDWQQVNTRLQSALAGWNEAQLDQYRLPHPLLGKLTVREMLFFTIYHNGHHLKAIAGNN